MKSLPKKAPAKKSKPVSRRRPAVQPIRKKPTAKKPVARKRPATRIGELGRESYPGMPDIPESVQKRIQEMIASGRMKAPTTPRKTTPRKTVAKKAAPKSAIKSAISRGGRTGDKIISGLASSRRGKTVKGNPFLMGKSKAAPKKTADSSSSAFKLPKRDFSRFDGQPGSGRVSSGTTVFDRYDPETDTYYGTIGGVAGSMPTSVKGSEVGEAFKKNWAAANKGYTPPKQQTQSQTPAPQTPAPQAPTPPPTQQQTGGGSFESAYVDWLQSKPKPFTMRQPRKIPSKKYRAAKKAHEKSVSAWEAREPSRATYTPPVTTAPTAPTAPVIQPDYVPPPPGEAPDKFAGRYVPPTSILGTPDMSISSNIVGQSFDPSFAASFRPPPQPPGSTFGGYGQQAPMAALAPYAGMAQNNPQPTDFFPTYIPQPAPIYETVQRPPAPEANNPPPTAPQRPIMGGGSGRMMGGVGIDRGFGRGDDQINFGEFTQYR